MLHIHIVGVLLVHITPLADLSRVAYYWIL